MFAQNETKPPPDMKTIDPQWAWSPYQPDTRRPWNLARAGHLYRRAAFGADWNQLQRTLDEGPRRTIERLLAPQADVAAFNQQFDRYETSSAASNSTDALRPWWLMRMMQSPHPLLEKMTLFWHGHFALSGAKVKNTRLMSRYVQQLRGEALGRFDSMLTALSHDPAVLLDRDAGANRKSKPCEHAPRELMAGTCLGNGNFSEKDIQEAARAFTGWFVLKGQVRFIPREYDSDAKQILGERGNFNDTDVVRLLLKQPATPRLLVRKLYRLLISETDEPSDAIVEPLAQSFAAEYDIAALVGLMLRSNLFFSPVAYRRRIKSPVEFTLGIVKGLEATVPAVRLGRDLADLGQNLYEPPTSAGWPGGRHWINPATSLARANLAFALLSPKKPYEGKLDPMAVAQKHGHQTGEAAERFLLDLFLQGDVETTVREAVLKHKRSEPSQELRRTAHIIVSLPEFQLA
ncbi:MAG: DUF1800 domain-containing protein [Pirellulales bacterium]|nr:DUF1800 domain-containing protein [Pirellulales bacterium]